MVAEQLVPVQRLLEAGAWLEAETQAQKMLMLSPTDVDAQLLLGIAIAAMGEAERAAPLLMQVAAQQSNAMHPCQQLAEWQPSLPYSLIHHQFQACLALSPADARLRLAFGNFLLAHGCPAEAEIVMVDASPDAAGHHLLGLAQADQAHFPAAIASFRQAVTLDPTAAASWSNLGMVLKIEGQFDAAVEAHDRALALAPNDARYRVNRAVTLLKSGRWEAAWQDYEWRLQLGGEAHVAPVKLLPSLADPCDLSGLTIVAQHEEGFGDTLQFLRYLPLLADRGAHVVAHVPLPLARLMRLVPGVAEVVTNAERLPLHDFVCPFFSLPRVFGTTVRTIPPTPRLKPDPALARSAVVRLPHDKLLVGLVWAGQSRPWLPGFVALDQRRSAGLAAFAPLSAIPGVHLVSLQMGPASRQIPPDGMRLVDCMAHVTDFADTAAIVAELDVVVSVDTSVVHLAGLMGKPVFLLDRYDSCWRWLTERRDSPWYPDLTIFRQTRPHDWSEPIAQVAASLDAMALFHGVSHAGSPNSTKREPARVA